MLAVYTLSRFPCSAGFGRFLQVSALASHWLEDCANNTPTPEETTNTAPSTLSAILYKHQGNPINVSAFFKSFS
jgi:hypothetical protein